MTADNITQILNGSKARHLFESLYGKDPSIIKNQVSRYENLVTRFKEFFPETESLGFYSAPGRTEVCGNHTDHNAGRVLAASVDLDIVAAVSKNNEYKINICSEGFEPLTIDLNDLAIKENEQFTSAALVRGVCSRMLALGYQIGGFNATMSSTVPNGSGLSSSAAYEVLICEILNQFYNEGRIDAVLNAQISQYAENDYFGKPCGLMDQTTCAVGGFVFIDFENLEDPKIEKMTFDMDAHGYSMMIISTGGDHADLNDDYTALENEMRDVARCFGPDVLRAVHSDKVYDNIDELRSQVNDRALLRAHHFYTEDLRVVQMVESIKTQNFAGFMEVMNLSGQSSWMYCQNCYSSKNIDKQGISIALMMSEKMLARNGAWRVHGGGFEGTIQVIIPKVKIDMFTSAMEKVFGEKSCHQVMIREAGVQQLELC